MNEPLESLLHDGISALPQNSFSILIFQESSDRGHIPLFDSRLDAKSPDAGVRRTGLAEFIFGAVPLLLPTTTKVHLLRESSQILISKLFCLNFHRYSSQGGASQRNRVLSPSASPGNAEVLRTPSNVSAAAPSGPSLRHNTSAPQLSALVAQNNVTAATSGTITASPSADASQTQSAAVPPPVSPPPPSPHANPAALLSSISVPLTFVNTSPSPRKLSTATGGSNSNVGSSISNISTGSAISNQNQSPRQPSDFSDRTATPQSPSASSSPNPNQNTGAVQSSSSLTNLQQSNSASASPALPIRIRANFAVALLCSVSAQSAFLGAYVVSHMLVIDLLLERIRDLLEQYLVQMYLSKDMRTKLLPVLYLQQIESVRDVTRKTIRELSLLASYPRLRGPVWLELISHPSHRASHIARFLMEMRMLAKQCNSSSSNRLLGATISGLLAHHRTWISTVSLSHASVANALSTKDPNIPNLEVDVSHTHLLGLLGNEWTNQNHTVTSSANASPNQEGVFDGTRSRSSSLIGSILRSESPSPLTSNSASFAPPSITKILVLGKNKELCSRFLFVLSYFLRCSEIFVAHGVPDELLSTPLLPNVPIAGPVELHHPNAPVVSGLTLSLQQHQANYQPVSSPRSHPSSPSPTTPSPPHNKPHLANTYLSTRLSPPTNRANAPPATQSAAIAPIPFVPVLEANRENLSSAALAKLAQIVQSTAIPIEGENSTNANALSAFSDTGDILSNVQVIPVKIGAMSPGALSSMSSPASQPRPKAHSISGTTASHAASSAVHHPSASSTQSSGPSVLNYALPFRSFAHSLIGGVCKEFCPHMVLSAVPGKSLEEVITPLVEELRFSTQKSIVEGVVSAHYLVANLDNNKCELISYNPTHVSTTPRIAFNRQEVSGTFFSEMIPAADSVNSIISEVSGMVDAQIPPENCVLYLEDRLAELIRDSELIVAANTLRGRSSSLEELTKTFGFEKSDLRLLLAIGLSHFGISNFSWPAAASPASLTTTSK